MTTVIHEAMENVEVKTAWKRQIYEDMNKTSKGITGDILKSVFEKMNTVVAGNTKVPEVTASPDSDYLPLFHGVRKFGSYNIRWSAFRKVDDSSIILDGIIVDLGTEVGGVFSALDINSILGINLAAKVSFKEFNDFLDSLEVIDDNLFLKIEITECKLLGKCTDINVDGRLLDIEVKVYPHKSIKYLKVTSLDIVDDIEATTFFTKSQIEVLLDAEEIDESKIMEMVLSRLIIVDGKVTWRF